MKKLFLDNLKILFPSIVALIISSLMWDKIKFEYNNPNQIIGYYSIFKYSALNDNVRYVFFIGLPILTYLISFIFFKKITFKSFNEALIFDQNYRKNENMSLYFLFYFIFIIFTFSIASEFNENLIDLFHEGQALSGALNLRLNNELWSGSFIITGLFVDLLNANISWNLFGLKSLSSYRLYIEILNLLTIFVIITFIFNLINGSNLNKNLKTVFFIFFCFFIYFFVDKVSFNYRELPIFLFLLFVHKIFINKKSIYLYSFILGVLPILSLLWSLDRGVFIIFAYLPLVLILGINRKINELFIIIASCIFSILVFYFSIGSIEFYYFLSNSKDILSSSDLLNGIIHPTPFTNEHGSARATKNLLLIILNGILMINYLYKKKSNLNKNSILFILVFYFLSLIFYKIGLTRSDGGHIKQGGSLNTIIFVYLVIYNILFLIHHKKYLKELNTNFYKYMNILFIFIFFAINVPNDYLRNTYNIKSRIVDYINIPDKNFLKKDEILLIKELKLLTKKQECFQVFSYETAISYYLDKPTCTKFYHIMNMGFKKNQLLFIDELKKSKPKFIVSGGNYQNIGNMKGRNKTELSAKDRFLYIDNFISNNYQLYKTIDKWNILILNK
jgi:hypothetical protein